MSKEKRLESDIRIREEAIVIELFFLLASVVIIVQNNFKPDIYSFFLTGLALLEAKVGDRADRKIRYRIK